MNNPKVYFILGKYGGCNYVRGLLPMWYNGWNGNIIGLKGTMKDVDLAKREMMESDVIVFHRPDTKAFHETAILLRGLGKKIVMDNDDTYYLDEGHPFWGRNDEGMEEDISKKNDLVHNFATNADLVTTTTEWLADEYRQYNKNVIVLPNLVNPKDWDTPLRNETNRVRIGLVGSVVYSQDFDLIRDNLRELDKMPNVQLVMFGLHNAESRRKNPKISEVYKREYEFFNSLENLEHVPWCEMINYTDTLNELRLDMMLIPRKECYFDKAKSNVKFLEAAMCEIPVIASSFADGNSPYDKDFNGKNGILVRNDDDWMPIIMDLINNKDKRLAIGKEAHRYVLENYNISDKYILWRDAFSKLLNE